MTMLVGPKSTKELAYGMSIGFDLLVSGFEERGLPHVIIDRSKGMAGRKVGSLSAGGIVATLSMILLFCLKLGGVRIIYLTIGTSRAGFLRDMLMIWLGWLCKKRLVLHLHGGGFLNFYETNPAWMKFLLRHTVNKADSIIVLGDLLRDQFQFLQDVEARLAVVPNGLPNELQSVEPINAKTIDSGRPFRLLYLSNMIPSKGYLDLIEACRILHFERRIPIHCDFCGAFVATVNDDVRLSPAEAEDDFRRLITEKELEHIVQYHGTVRGETKRQMLQSAHLFLLPTAYPWEGQPISIIEALAYGLPVVATRYRGIPEQVVDGYNGFLLDEKSPQAIADAVERFWRDPSLYEQCSRHAVQHFLRHFTREAHLNRLIPVILGQGTDYQVGR